MRYLFTPMKITILLHVCLQALWTGIVVYDVHIDVQCLGQWGVNLGNAGHLSGAFVIRGEEDQNCRNFPLPGDFCTSTQNL